MEPGTYIAIAQIAFQGACVSVKTFRKGLNFSKDAERLVLNLEVERFRLDIWGENVGLAPPDGQTATLPDRLLPICSILKAYLEQIERLVLDADSLSSRYGLSQTESPPTKSALVRQLVERMQRSIHPSGGKLAAGSRDEEDEEDGQSEDASHAGLAIEIATPVKKRSTTIANKVRWAVRDLDKFESLVKDVALRINKLNDLMTETQQRKTRADNYRVNMVVVGSVIDKASLELIRAAVQGEPDTSQVRAAVERKGLAVSDASQDRQVVGVPNLQRLSLDDFILPGRFATLKRFITAKKSDSAAGTYYLLERKSFDPSIQPEDLARLTSRIQRLVLLLQKPKSPDFRTPKAEGCIKDPANCCWWIVFRFLQGVSSPSVNIKPKPTTPVSLLTLLTSACKFRPPLEQRLALANTFCTTLSELYLSGWLHKSIRSENILFPAAPLSLVGPFSTEDMQRTLSEPLLTGFDYTRHESEWATIDRARTAGDVMTAIYRHPLYQGEAAQGYRLQYDVYSAGLVLVEIALWMPLASFLESRKPAGAPKSKVETGLEGFSLGEGRVKSAIVELSGDMKVFHEPHALELRKRVLARVEAELAFAWGRRTAEQSGFAWSLQTSRRMKFRGYR
ncbi:hypothetical protein NEMBOFW57_010976 [Staphylotrichum longicolle]|uniref:Prion-inhibition and propagation HeLo domain-containing protein n=1 Tax=Staphylotrichum longicolle TaxID=669026 RepID=A0AAD4HXJ5_9PEZI|nr:hypothetical protein NEMBOFW57_010976 [Staphylotrichum longicolle]